MVYGLGYVTWKEFQVHFLLAKGYPQSKAEKQAEDHEALSLESSGECTDSCCTPLRMLSFCSRIDKLGESFIIWDPNAHDNTSRLWQYYNL